MKNYRRRPFKGLESVLALAVALMTSCSRLPYPPSSSPSGGGSVLTGIASWYGSDFHGRQTSNREIYNMYDLTAAHKTLPFRTKLMVTNLNNGRSTVVRINDRGPFVGDRIIDLSYAAAGQIDMLESGLAPVRLEILDDGSPGAIPPPVAYSVQVGSYADADNARDLQKELRSRFRDVYIAPCETRSRTYYRVRVKAKDKEASLRLAQVLSEIGYRVLILEED